MVIRQGIRYILPGAGLAYDVRAAQYRKLMRDCRLAHFCLFGEVLDAMRAAEKHEKDLYTRAVGKKLIEIQ